jgi:flagellar hook-associated protein 1 FlgK
MSTIFGSFEIAKSGLSVAMLQLNVTEQNIANANTKGYTRQRAVTSAVEPNSSNYLIAPRHAALVGQGVEVINVTQIRSDYLDAQYRKLNTDYYTNESIDQALTYLNGVFNELDEDAGLTTAIKNFYSALNTFSSDPSSHEFRTNVQQQAQALTDTFNTIYDEMRSLWEDQNASIRTDVEQINSYAEKIAALNLAIARAVQADAATNDLKDELNLLLDELSGYVSIEYKFNENQTVDITIGGNVLVTGRQFSRIDMASPVENAEAIDGLTQEIAGLNAQIAAALEAGEDIAELETQLQEKIDELSEYLSVTVETDADTNQRSVFFEGVALVSGAEARASREAVETNLEAWVAFHSNTLTLNGETLDFDGAITGGRLYGHVRMATSLRSDAQGIPFYMNQLNELARGMARDINAIHREGWTYPSGGTLSQTGINFFHVPGSLDEEGNPLYDYSTVTAGNIRLSEEVLASPNFIAASSETVNLEAGVTESGNNVVARALYGTLSKNGYFDKLNSIVADLAIETDTVRNIMATKDTLVTSVDTQRMSLSSVSMDEETTNLIMFQQTYNACARVVTTISDMIDTLVNRMGV